MSRLFGVIQHGPVWSSRVKIINEFGMVSNIVSLSLRLASRHKVRSLFEGVGIAVDTKYEIVVIVPSTSPASNALASSSPSVLLISCILLGQDIFTRGNKIGNNKNMCNFQVHLQSPAAVTCRFSFCNKYSVRRGPWRFYG